MEKSSQSTLVFWNCSSHSHVKLQDSKMRVLEINYRVFIALWVFPTPSEESGWIKFRNKAFGIICIILNASQTIASCAFIYKFVTNDFMTSLFALLHICPNGQTTYQMIVSYLIWPQIEQLFTEIQGIYDERK